jgi:ATP-dependent DNA helicase RecQ
VSTILFDETHTYVQWDTFRPVFDSLKGIALDFPKARLVAASATLTTKQLEDFSSQINVKVMDWKMVIYIVLQHNHVYHIIKECVLLRHASTLFANERLPLLVVVNSLAVMTSLYSWIVAWSNLPLSSVWLFAAGFSEQHLKEADSTFRDPNDRLKIMIATSAYSLGIDAFIRSVIHYSVPSDIASYLQGIGRCGRDPSIEEAHCTLVIDGVGLQAADKEMHVFLGCA